MKDITENNKIVSIKKHGMKVKKRKYGCTGCSSCRCRCRGWIPGWATKYGVFSGVRAGHVVF